MKEFGKAIVNLVVAAAGALIVALGGGNGDGIGDLSTKTWLVAAGTVLASSALVHIVDNIHGVAGGVMKAAIAFLTSGIGSLVVALDDNHITQAEWLIAFTTAASATGLVYQVTGRNRNAPRSGTTNRSDLET